MEILTAIVLLWFVKIISAIIKLIEYKNENNL